MADEGADRELPTGDSVGLARGVVVLEPYDPAWREAYEREVERLEPIVGDRVASFEHVGSTAIEGMAAKPIVDLLGVVDDLEAARDLLDPLESAGYEYRPKDDESERLLLAKGPRENRTHYLKLTERSTDFHRESVAVRDYLRDNPDVAAEYAALKRDLAERFPDDRDAYTERKAGFIEDVLDEALDR